MDKAQVKPRPEKAAKNAVGDGTPKRRTDWEAVERDFRTANFTLRELSDKYGCSHQAISKQAKVKGWSQDLGHQIRQATNAKLVATLVSNEIAKGGQEVANTVLAAAEVNKQVILGHRGNLQRITAVAGVLMAQIEQAAAQMPDLSEVIEMVRNPDERNQDRANDALRKAMDRPALVDDLKKLAEINERVIKGERQAFSLDEKPDDNSDDMKTGRTLTDAERAVRLYNILTKAKA